MNQMSIVDAISRVTKFVDGKLEDLRIGMNRRVEAIERARDGYPPANRAFCPKCSSRLFYLYVRGEWKCDKGHTFLPTDHQVARFDIPPR